MKYGRSVIYLLLFTGCTINYIDRVVLSVSAPRIQAEFGLTTVSLGYLFSAFLWTYLIFVLPWGIYIDRAGTRSSTALGMGIWSLATILTGLSGSFMTAFLARLAMGFGEASTYPAGARVIREWMPARERGVATTIFNCGGYAGPALGSLTMGAIVAAFGWRAAFWGAGLIGIVWLAAWLLFFRQPEEARFISDEERRTILNERGGTAKPGVASSTTTLLGYTATWGLAITQGCAVYTVYLFLTWLPSYLHATRGLDVLQTGFYTAIPYAVAVPGTIFVGWLSDRLLRGVSVASGRRRYLVTIMMLMSSGILLTPLITNTTVLLAVFSLSLTCIGSTVGLNIALQNDLLVNPGDVGRANGILVTGGNLFGVVAPIATGYIVSGTGNYDSAFLMAGGLLLVGAIVCLTMSRLPIGTAPETSNGRLAA